MSRESPNPQECTQSWKSPVVPAASDGPRGHTRSPRCVGRGGSDDPAKKAARIGSLSKVQWGWSKESVQESHFAPTMDAFKILHYVETMGSHVWYLPVNHHSRCEMEIRPCTACASHFGNQFPFKGNQAPEGAKMSGRNRWLKWPVPEYREAQSQETPSTHMAYQLKSKIIESETPDPHLFVIGTIPS